MDSIDYLKKEISVTINLYNAKRYEDVIRKSKILIKKYPEQILLYNILSLSLSAQNKNDEAISHLNKALNLDPNNIFVLNNLGLIYSNLYILDKSEFYLNESLKKNSNFFDALINFGNLLTKKGESENSIKFYEKALKNAKTNIQNEVSLMALGSAYQQIGNFEESVKTYKKLLQINPNQTKADKAISLIHKYKSNEDDHLMEMIQKEPNIKNDDDYKTLCFALGKAYEDIEDFDKSFQFIQKANKIEKNLIKYEINQDIKTFNGIKKLFSNVKLKKTQASEKKIIFIVGMPRSGTTLTEQIISSHTEVFGAGELPYLSEFFNKEISDNNLLKSEENLDKSEELLKNCQNHYFDKLNKHNIKEKIIIDKAPLNFKWIGFIISAFPNSKIIHCKRDPMAICWSNFKNSFSSKSIGFSYNLDDLGKYYNLYDDLIQFWVNLFSEKIYNLDYENLVNNKKEEIKKIIEFCELEWDENCLNPEKNKKSVSTASLSQVRSPIYKSSLKNWENFSGKLGELKKILKVN